MKTKKQNNIVDWDDHLDQKYGKKGTASREKYAEDSKHLKLESFPIRPNPRKYKSF